MDFFRLLGAGAKFNKEKYSSDYKTFDEKVVDILTIENHYLYIKKT
jgi:hypothetical protein